MKNIIKVYVLSSENVPYTANKAYKKFEGAQFSSINDIMVEEIDGEYTILYTESVLQCINPVDLVSSIAELFTSNLPGERFTISLIYEYCLDYNFAIKEGINIKQISDTTLRILMIMEWRLAQNETGLIDYYPLQDFKVIQSLKLSDEYSSVDTDQKYINNEDRDYEDSTYEDNLTLDDIVGEMFGITLDSDDNDKKKKNKSKKDRHYASSRILKSADNPKKMYKRHGVIVTDSRKAVKRDEKIIKDFLKDFIPGGAGWKKDFRKDVLKRWLNSYAVSKKSLKILEKKHKKKIRKNKRGVIDADRAIALTRRLFATSTDIWNDPTK